tara:strand:- start:7713 stop:9257 length:1545 start_codon:yes stop_codon:yes gene_type:complete
VAKRTPPRTVPALTVHQWLPGWDKISFDPKEYRSKPPQHFYLFSLPARELRSLSGISRRVAKGAASRTEDLGIQRQHDPERSEEIGRFVEFGYPWSTLSETKRASGEFSDLRKPGWLPTAIVLNVLTDGSKRNNSNVAKEDLVTIEETAAGPKLQLPYEKWEASWSPKKLPPFEVIDGQHRLWAFDKASSLANFELPVVAFVGLDISWQAYLFWTINIKPKRINASLAFDLYPLLRSEDWLERAEGHPIYRETRAQELTEIMWSYPDSPWYDRINMLGERQNPWVSQSAWIKSLMASLVRAWDKRSRSSLAGGLFGGRGTNEDEVLGWNRAQQAAFLIFAWNAFKDGVAASKEDWATNLRSGKKPEARHAEDAKLINEDLAFYGPYSLINTDQGVRGFLQILNDIFYLYAAKLKLNEWRPNERASSDPIHSIPIFLESIAKQNFSKFIKDLGTNLSSFDWRTSATPGLEEDVRRSKLVFRGSGGYKELRTQLLEHLAGFDSEIGKTAKRLIGKS